MLLSSELSLESFTAIFALKGHYMCLSFLFETVSRDTPCKRGIKLTPAHAFYHSVSEFLPFKAISAQEKKKRGTP